MTNIRYSVLLSLIVLALTFPFFIKAQQDADATQLRAQIQASVITDPRSAKLTKAELTALIDSLAGVAEAQGLTYDFIPIPPIPETFGSSQDIVGTILGYPLTQGLMYGIVLLSLAIAMIALRKFLGMHAHKPETVSSGSFQ